MEDEERDFLDEIMTQETAKNPRFPEMVAAAEARQLQEREAEHAAQARRERFGLTAQHALRAQSNAGRTRPQKRQDTRNGRYLTGSGD